VARRNIPDIIAPMCVSGAAAAETGRRASHSLKWRDLWYQRPVRARRRRQSYLPLTRGLRVANLD
jgi:hypothetical protein